jgi:hypothetical protein
MEEDIETPDLVYLPVVWVEAGFDGNIQTKHNTGVQCSNQNRLCDYRRAPANPSPIPKPILIVPVIAMMLAAITTNIASRAYAMIPHTHRAPTSQNLISYTTERMTIHVRQTTETLSVQATKSAIMQDGTQQICSMETNSRTNRFHARCSDCGHDFYGMRQLARHIVFNRHHQVIVLKADEYNRKTGLKTHYVNYREWERANV